jgi:Rrf2 family protein
MKLSHTAAYAVCALVHLHRTEPGKFQASQRIARAEGMPALFVRKLFGALIRALLVLSQTGPYGGFRLARPATAISLLEIVEAVDGPIRGSVPQVVTGADVRTDRRLQAACDAAAEIVRRNLRRVSVAVLAGRRKGVHSWARPKAELRVKGSPAPRNSPGPCAGTFHRTGAYCCACWRPSAWLVARPASPPPAPPRPASPGRNRCPPWPRTHSMPSAQHTDPTPPTGRATSSRRS